MVAMRLAIIALSPTKIVFIAVALDGAAAAVCRPSVSRTAVTPCTGDPE